MQKANDVLIIIVIIFVWQRERSVFDKINNFKPSLNTKEDNAELVTQWYYGILRE